MGIHFTTELFFCHELVIQKYYAPQEKIQFKVIVPGNQIQSEAFVLENHVHHSCAKVWSIPTSCLNGVNVRVIQRFV